MKLPIDISNVNDDFWEQPASIITDVEFLSQPTENVESLELGEKIAAKLFNTLNKVNKIKKQGIGLTANQIGINKSVFIVHVNEPLYFINPEIIAYGKDKITYTETCLSLPNKKSRISRHMSIQIKADNLSEPKWFGIEYDGKEIDEKEIDEKEIDESLVLESIVIQHEFNHTQGILITDLDEREMPIKIDKKYNRNDIVTISKENESKQIKFKKLDIYKKDGWTLIV